MTDEDRTSEPDDLADEPKQGLLDAPDDDTTDEVISTIPEDEE